jgi:signal transduction histidine kinase/CheY-like chemotaxis protein
MLVILLIIFIRTKLIIKNKSALARCRGFLFITASYVALDAAFITCHLTESLHGLPFGIVAFLFYIVYVLMPFFWYLFVRTFVGSTFRVKIIWAEYIPLAILLVAALTTPFTGLIWSLDDVGMYVRGSLFTYYIYLNYFYYLLPLVYAVVIFLRKEQKKEPYVLQSCVISLVPLIAAGVNNIVIPVYQIYPFQPFVSVIVALLAYFFMAAKENDRQHIEHQEAIAKSLKAAEEASAAAKEASEVKTAFLSNMSHDIRTPMNAIINLTKIAQTETDVNVIHSYLDKINISSNFLLGLINDILDMSKIESGEFELHKDALTRAEFLDTIDTVVQPLMDAKHIDFHKELRPGEYTIGVDKVRFNQIFFNLLSNAAKFTPEGGDVWFEVDNLEVSDNKLKILFIVRDNGIGMSEEFLKHLYEPFAREHSALNSNVSGTGLGLPIVKSLVSAMGGEINVKSKLGEGTEFDVTFYVDILSSDDGSSDYRKSVDTTEHNLGGMKVLLAEDNELNTYVAKLILEKAGCKVTTVSNGQEAVDAFSSSQPGDFDAILMDIRMPIVDGIEATKKIRLLERTGAAEIPIIAMTADAFDEERKRTLEAGMNDHLSKPVDAEKIYAVLAKYSKNHEYTK